MDDSQKAQLPDPVLIEDVQDPPSGKLTVVQAYDSYTPEFAAQTERKLIRKVDLRLLPLVIVMYVSNYLDRNSITQARLYGLQQDLNVKGATYNTAISIFSAGYIVMQLPSTLMMTKVRPSIFLPTCIIAWAILSGLTSATQNASGLLALRFCLGLVEAPFFPCAIYLLSCWYTKRELGFRMSLLVSGLLLSNSFAGLISAGILSGMDGVGHIATWRWLFILEGSATVILGLIGYLVLPDYPATTKWLSEEEKIVAQARLTKSIGSDDFLTEETASVRRGVVWAAKDYRVWLFSCLQMATTADISYSHFFPTLIKDLGFKSNTETLLLTSPPYLFAFFFVVAICYFADRKQRRSVFAIVSICIAICSCIVLIATNEQNQWIRYAISFPLTAGTFSVYATTYTWLSSTIPQPAIKRAAAIGIANSWANLASLYANYFWLDGFAPTYRISWVIVLAFQVLGLASMVALRLSLKRSNRKFEKLSQEVSPSDTSALARLDIDERRAVVGNFRYVA
ncbi:hypothetical protein PV08_00395 [Exophiala spinifera]|uniref:Major facilitator superfamily (MFS) profile domain-containing protein n=1 Tax=Exophiala spinifera TaxID=91928 RepID=A0A0D2BMK9_9EURO|nr:uncharacterized protein PV08_00395 [Exophiala spinifera]KIW19820.1 hypothetical protein PV08_00395 [Exophiala spinifera]